MWAAASGHAGLVRLLAARSAELDARGGGAQPSALLLAAANDHPDVVEALIERGSSVDLQDLGGFTACMLAAQKGHTAIVQQLLRAGADPALRSYTAPSGDTALGLAAAGGHTAVVRALLAARQDGTATKLLDGLSHERLLMLVQQLVAALQVRRLGRAVELPCCVPAFEAACWREQAAPAGQRKLPLRWTCSRSSLPANKLPAPPGLFLPSAAGAGGAPAAAGSLTMTSL